MKDRKGLIIEAGLAVLREHGYPGFSQPRVAAKAGVRQSHLTYYFPTRVDLLTAVARTAIDRQSGAIGGMLSGSSAKQASGAIASTSVRRDTTRVLLAIAQAADQEPTLRALFREFADGFILHIGNLLENLGIKPTAEHCYLIHALSAGLAVIDFAIARPDGEERAANVLRTTFALLASQQGKATAAASKPLKASSIKGKSRTSKSKKESAK